MQIGGASSYPAPAATLLPARLLASNISPDVSPDITRAAQSPVTAAQPLAKSRELLASHCCMADIGRSATHMLTVFCSTFGACIPGGGSVAAGHVHRIGDVEVAQPTVHAIQDVQ